jgi:hypothetical protein
MAPATNITIYQILTVLAHYLKMDAFDRYGFPDLRLPEASTQLKRATCRDADKAITKKAGQSSDRPALYCFYASEVGLAFLPSPKAQAH